MIKPIIAYAIVNKKKPQIKILDIYVNKDVVKNDNEKFIKVKIVPIK